MFIVLLTKEFVQIIYFVIKTDNFFHYFQIFCKNIEIVKMKLISKYFMFGKYNSLDTKAGGRCMHACISST